MPEAVNWQPCASLDSLRRRAEVLARIRAFFARRGVLEVETPLLAQAGVTDPQLHNLQVPGTGGVRYLQTSPEYAMKRLLAAGSGPIYQLGKAFRAEEAGRWHECEFTLLEWYRPGFDHHALMDEIDALLLDLGAPQAAQRIAYAELFDQQLGLDPLEADAAQLTAAIDQHVGAVEGELDRDEALDLLMGAVIGPGLGRESPVFVVDYPASQAALARLNSRDSRVASRFELYWKGLELANGFFELTDAAEQRRRFVSDNRQRAARGLEEMPLDEKLLAALAAGLPDCAGVAVGVDRLFAALVDAQSLDQVIAFRSP